MYNLNDAIKEKCKEYGLEFTDDEIWDIIFRNSEEIAKVCGQADTEVTAKFLEEMINKEIKNKRNIKNANTHNQ